MVQLVVGRILRAHGVRGEMTVDVRTDSPDERFAPGSVLDTDPPEAGPLTVAAARMHSGRLLVGFEGVLDRSGAARLGGVRLVVDSDSLPTPDDPDEFLDHHLVGLAAVTVGGGLVGTVTEVVHGPAGDLLVVGRPGGKEVFVPFVTAFVPEVDVAGGRVVLDPPEGLLEL